jgi:hypothetical protein
MKIAALWKTTLKNGKTAYIGTLRYPGTQEKIMLVPTDSTNPRAPDYELLLLNDREPPKQTHPAQEPEPPPPEEPGRPF